jgi:hypothetical protein
MHCLKANHVVFWFLLESPDFFCLIYLQQYADFRDWGTTDGSVESIEITKWYIHIRLLVLCHQVHH